jgi:hypothetical protein
MDRKDKEMTVAAARAVGVSGDWALGGYWVRDTVPPFKHASLFAPLESDETAFQLMVMLDINPEPGRLERSKTNTYDRVFMTVKGRGHIFVEVMYGDDRLAAWRRAIVETAAALDADKQGE